MTDWPAWHKAYDSPGSSLARRLEVVRRRVGESLSALSARGEVRILSLCAGDGRDLLPELAVARARTSHAILIEKDPVLAAAARSAARDRGLSDVAIIIGDAGRSATFARWLPVDLLLLCGIFGNISEDDIRLTVAAAPAMVRPDGIVIWTRGNMEPELRPAIRQWFNEASFDEVAFDGEPEPYGVGVGRRRLGAAGRELPELLFQFHR